MAATVLADFSRQLRDEPLHYIYRHKIWLAQPNIESIEVHTWLKKRYADHKRGHRYRVCLYKDGSGHAFVDFVLLETLTEEDLTYMSMRWGFSKEPIARVGRKKRRRLTKDQRAQRDRILAAFYASLDHTAG